MDTPASDIKLLENKQAVPKEFNRIASRYDFTTGLSQGYQADIVRSASYLALKGDETVLDLCCGTGRSVRAILQYLSTGRVIGIDNSEEMLAVARKKLSGEIEKGKVEFHLRDAMHLDYPDGHFSHIFVAYGLRNMPDYGKFLESMYRLLKPGGRLVIHDYSLVDRWYARPFWLWLGYLFIIPIGVVSTGSSKIFSYLVNSVLQFLKPAEVENLMREKKFVEVSSHPQKSWRNPILRTFVGNKI
jgi:ubiquinone/menaquinone biosynthesis methyltransferase